MRHYIFLILTGTLFAALAVLFLFFPRPTFSDLERRELKTPPEFSFGALFSGEYTAEVSSWFSDSQPYRDDFMTLSMAIKKQMGLLRGRKGEEFVFHQTGDIAAAMIPGELDETGKQAAGELENVKAELPGDAAGVADNEDSRMSQSGILIVGSGDNVRALMGFYGSAKAANPYIVTANAYGRALGAHGIKVYSMVVPIAMEFYCPEEARARKGLYVPQLPVINHIYAGLEGVKGVNVYNTLAEHAGEDIYLRTDHHWAPLGAYYAARKFAETAGVHVPVLSEFNRKVIHRFVGTMYGFSKDITVKNAPEDFVYHTPQDGTYSTTFRIVNLDSDFKITGESKPFKASYFKKFKDGSSNAYLTFMGSDYVIVKVKGSGANGRRLAVLKDSYGNALPGYLFGSFDEVHVLDFRYFPHNIVDYCRRNGITDFLIVNNIFNACSSGVAAKQKALLTRKSISGGTPHEDTAAKGEGIVKEKTVAERDSAAGNVPSVPEKPAAAEAPVMIAPESDSLR